MMGKRQYVHKDVFGNEELKDEPQHFGQLPVDVTDDLLGSGQTVREAKMFGGGEKIGRVGDSVFHPHHLHRTHEPDPRPVSGTKPTAGLQDRRGCGAILAEADGPLGLGILLGLFVGINGAIASPGGGVGWLTFLVCLAGGLTFTGVSIARFIRNCSHFGTHMLSAMLQFLAILAGPVANDSYIASFVYPAVALCFLGYEWFVRSVGRQATSEIGAAPAVAKAPVQATEPVRPQPLTAPVDLEATTTFNATPPPPPSGLARPPAEFWADTTDLGMFQARQSTPRGDIISYVDTARPWLVRPVAPLPITTYNDSPLVVYAADEQTRERAVRKLASLAERVSDALAATSEPDWLVGVYYCPPENAVVEAGTERPGTWPVHDLLVITTQFVYVLNHEGAILRAMAQRDLTGAMIVRAKVETSPTMFNGLICGRMTRDFRQQFIGPIGVAEHAVIDELETAGLAIRYPVPGPRQVVELHHLLGSLHPRV